VVTNDAKGVMKRVSNRAVVPLIFTALLCLGSACAGGGSAPSTALTPQAPSTPLITADPSHMVLTLEDVGQGYSVVSVQTPSAGQPPAYGITYQGHPGSYSSIQSAAGVFPTYDAAHSNWLGVVGEIRGKGAKDEPLAASEALGDEMVLVRLDTDNTATGGQSNSTLWVVWRSRNVVAYIADLNGLGSREEFNALRLARVEQSRIMAAS
jgi:hypothetical protein